MKETNSLPRMLEGLRELADRYDTLLCDVFGVLHAGGQVYPDAAQALMQYRQSGGCVVLVSNAPRSAEVLIERLNRAGVPAACYDAVLTSGMLAKEAVHRRAASEEVGLYYMGPEADRKILDGLPITISDIGDATLVLCTGLENDETESPKDYCGTLQAMRSRNLTMICANPDILVIRNGRSIPCAGALAKLYAETGGHVEYFGKPLAAIFSTAKEIASQYGAGRGRTLVVGDGLETDVAGANQAALDCLFVTGGLHRRAVLNLASGTLGQFMATFGVHSLYAIEFLRW